MISMEIKEKYTDWLSLNLMMMVLLTLWLPFVLSRITILPGFFFFRKRKSTCFKSLNSNSRLKVAFVELGSLWDLSGNIFDVLQSFIVILYGEKNVNVNETRHTIFSRKFWDENKTVNMNVLQHWESVLRLHSERINYLAATWKGVAITNFTILIWCCMVGTMTKQ